MDEIVWILEATVLAIHNRQIAEHGGAAGLRDEGMLHSALARPQNLFLYEHPDVASRAAAYAFGIVRNHPFIDGNKRTALVVARTFLLLNCANFKATQGEKYQIFMQLAEGTLNEEALAQWMRERM